MTYDQYRKQIRLYANAEGICKGIRLFAVANPDLSIGQIADIGNRGGLNPSTCRKQAAIARNARAAA